MNRFELAKLNACVCVCLSSNTIISWKFSILYLSKNVKVILSTTYDAQLSLLCLFKNINFLFMRSFSDCLLSFFFLSFLSFFLNYNLISENNYIDCIVSIVNHFDRHWISALYRTLSVSEWLSYSICRLVSQPAN